MARKIYAIAYVIYPENLIKYYAYNTAFLDTRYEISFDKWENLRKTFTLAETTNNSRQGIYLENWSK